MICCRMPFRASAAHALHVTSSGSRKSTRGSARVGPREHALGRPPHVTHLELHFFRVSAIAGLSKLPDPGSFTFGPAGCLRLLSH